MPLIVIALLVAVRLVTGVTPPAVTTDTVGLALLMVVPTSVPAFPWPLRSASVAPPIRGQNPTCPLVTAAGADLI